MSGISAIIKETPEGSPHVRTGEDGSLQSGRELSPERDHAGMLSSDFHPPEL